jgi:Peptidase inhibitor I78 family
MTLTRNVLLVSLLTLSWSTIACTRSDDGVTSPTSAGSSSGPADRGPASPRPSPPTSASCDAAKAQFAVGSAASDELLERARVAAQAALARFLRPNEPITMEFLGSRLNLNLNERGIVHSTYCG